MTKAGSGLVTKYKGKYEIVRARGFTAKRWHVRPELWWEEAVRPCSACKADTHWRRPLKGGAPTHPACETSVFETVTDEVLVDVIFELAEALAARPAPPATATASDPAVSKSEGRRLGNPDAGCELCGVGYAALWFAARTWRCGKHAPSNGTYRRGRP